jgi:hypothetical protein
LWGGRGGGVCLVWVLGGCRSLGVHVLEGGGDVLRLLGCCEVLAVAEER